MKSIHFSNCIIVEDDVRLTLNGVFACCDKKMRMASIAMK